MKYPFCGQHKLSRKKTGKRWNKRTDVVTKTVLRSMKRYYTKYVLMCSDKYKFASLLSKRGIALDLLKDYVMREFKDFGYNTHQLSQIASYL